jgi:glucokinase
MKMNNQNIIGIDLGATNIRGAVVKHNSGLSTILSQKINSAGSVE